MVFFSAGQMAVAVYRFGRLANAVPKPLKIIINILYFPLFYIVQALTGISVQAYADIGKRFVIRNSGCIFIVAEKIGDDFTVSQGVTIGNVRGTKRLPILGNNVYLEPGAKILGEVIVGNNVIVRANSLVLTNVPDNSIVIGNPARILPNPDLK